MDYQVLLYYHYTPIADPQAFAQEHLAVCRSLNLLGRILVATEGINGTVSGRKEDTEAYMAMMQADDRFQGIVFKIDAAKTHAFKKLFVRPRKELVALNLAEDVDPRVTTGEYLTPAAFRERLFDEDTVILDARNDYEYDLGHFRGAVRPDIRHFRELPEWIVKNKELFADKKIVTYCTGGIRCEKFSGWLLKEGFQDVAQLEGGIATYGKAPETRGEFWEGAMYVFDERIAVEINQVNKSIIGQDWFDQTPCERYVNCGNPACNRQMLASPANQEKYLGGCSPACRKAANNRYIKERQWSASEVAARLAMIGE